MKTTVVHHSADFDGIFCREIAKRFLNHPGHELELIGWDYGDEKLAFPDGTVFVLDLSPECFEDFESAPKGQNRLIWIDHHKTSLEKFEKLHQYGLGFRIDGVAACRLAWQWFTMCKAAGEIIPRALEFPTREVFVERQVNEPLAVRLAGEYDVWDKRDPNAELFQHGLRSRALEGLWPALLSETIYGTELVQQLLASGQAVQYAQQEGDAGTVLKRSFEVKWEGLNFLALNTARCNSLTFAAAVQPEHDGLLGFFWNGRSWKVSLYGTPYKREVDLSVIAKKHGGGGHRQACGFEVLPGRGTEKLPFLKS